MTDISVFTCFGVEGLHGALTDGLYFSSIKKCLSEKLLHLNLAVRVTLFKDATLPLFHCVRRAHDNR